MDNEAPQIGVFKYDWITLWITIPYDAGNSQQLFSTLLIYFGTRVYLFLPDERPCYVFSTQNNCCELLASYGVIIQSAIQSYLKTPICGASLSYRSIRALSFHAMQERRFYMGAAETEWDFSGLFPFLSPAGESEDFLSYIYYYTLLKFKSFALFWMQVYNNTVHVSQEWEGALPNWLKKWKKKECYFIVLLYRRKFCDGHIILVYSLCIFFQLDNSYQ